MSISMVPQLKRLKISSLSSVADMELWLVLKGHLLIPLIHSLPKMGLHVLDLLLNKERNALQSLKSMIDPNISVVSIR